MTTITLYSKAVHQGISEGGGDKFWHADYIDMSFPYAAGGLYSRVEDLYLWDRALYTEALVSQESLDMMFTPFVDVSPTAKYGYGWGIAEDYKQTNRKAIGHGGRISGFVTYIVRFVDDDVVIIVSSNIEEAPTRDRIVAGPIAIVFEEE
jgi:CubicO group peptidase (beta-lactamase class C family)